jgi:formylglycine-generating enzyme required for sulfatase activity
MRGERPDPRDDVYALGVIWYQLLTSDLTSPAPAGRRWADGLRRRGMSDEALDLLSSCFESYPAHRPSDAGVLAELLEALPRPTPPEYLTTRVGLIKLKRIPAGAFLMGSPEDDGEADDDEKPQHRVEIRKPFYLGVYEINQAQYQAVTGENPSWFSPNGGGKDKIAGRSTGEHPVENVSWLDAVKFCNKLSEMEGLKPFYEIHGEKVQVSDWTGPGYRLPKEAEWEYACRANAPTPQRYTFGDNPGSLGKFAWYSENSGSATHPVGEKDPNGFGLFDMHGNVWEWCWDSYSASYYKGSTPDDPSGPTEATVRVIRGGGWRRDPRGCRSAIRSGRAPAYLGNSLGFRLALGQSGR